MSKVYSQLVALAGSPAIVDNVLSYLTKKKGTALTVDDVVTEIVGRRQRAEERIKAPAG
ncbi:MAG: hypothetical protein ACJ8GN_24990 [Longimicrobiaceae bacterium]